MTPNHHLRNVFYSFALLCIIILILYIGKSIIIPFTMAFFLAFFINKLRLSFQNIPFIGTYIPDLLGFFAATFVIIGVIIIFYEIINANVISAQSLLPDYIEQAKKIQIDATQFLSKFPLLQETIISTSEGYLNPDSIGNFLSYLVKSTTGWIRSFATSFTTISIYTIFILLERNILLRKILKCIGNEKAKKNVSKTLTNIGSMIEQYVLVKTLTSLMVSSLCFIILYFAEVDFPLLWTFIIFIFNFIPIIGSVIAVILPFFIALIQPGGGPGLAIIVLIGLAIMQQFIGAFVEPRLFGKTLNISPLVVLLSLTMGQALWGIIGMLLCIPITVAIMIICSQFKSTLPIAILLSSNGLDDDVLNNKKK